MNNYVRHLESTQREPLRGKKQIKNNAGGYVFESDDFTQLERFLILGSEDGSYYVSERKLTRENADVVLRCETSDASRTVDTIAGISESGRAPRNDAAIFALALIASDGKENSRRLALMAIPRVCRTGTHLFQFVQACNELRGWGRLLREGVSNWYNGMEARKLAYQVTKYRNRAGFTHRDVLRLAHPKAVDGSHNSLYKYLTSGVVPAEECLRQVVGFEILKKTTDPKLAARLIEEYSLTLEHVPTGLLTSPWVWDALLPNLPLTALLRNLGRLSSLDYLKPLSSATKFVCERLRDVRRAKVHPLSILLALTTYKNGCGVRGHLNWHPVQQIVSALDDAFYLAFESVVPTGKRYLLGLDVSGSMTQNIANTHLSCREAAAALSMVTKRTEEQAEAIAFTRSIVPFELSRGDQLGDIVRRMSACTFGPTDCAAPILYATLKKLEVDAFIVYTDNETWAGALHPCKALKQYREKSGINAKLVVVGMASNGFSISDPDDDGMLDVVGFDASCPSLISDFVRC